MMEETIEPGGDLRAVAQEFSPVPYGSIRVSKVLAQS